MPIIGGIRTGGFANRNSLDYAATERYGSRDLVRRWMAGSILNPMKWAFVVKDGRPDALRIEMSPFTWLI